MNSQQMDEDDELLDINDENELQEFKEKQGSGYNYLPLSVAGKVQKTVFAVGKIGSVCLIVVLLAMFLVQVSHFGVTIQTLVQLNAMKACDTTSQPCTGRSTADPTLAGQNITAMLQQVIQTTGDSAQKLIEIVGTLSNIESTGTDTAGVIDDILLIVTHLSELHNESSSFAPLTSCKAIKQRDPNSPSGEYLLAHPNSGETTYNYCNMGMLCGSGGGWTRLAYLNMNDSTASCPSGFRLYHSGEIRACGRATSNTGSCVSVQFPSNGISYSQVCGRVVGYQYGTTDAADSNFGNGGHNNLNSWYIDGVSITRGSPRQHVWTLMAGWTNSFVKPTVNCPCSNGSTQQTQSFVGNDYFCASGNPNSGAQSKLYTLNPLWDGQGCGSLEAACCSAPGLPWFHKNYGSTTTTDYIELRVCGDERTSNEDVPVSYYEIYVQ